MNHLAGLQLYSHFHSFPILWHIPRDVFNSFSVVFSICHVFVEYLKCSLIWKIIVTDFSLLVWKLRDRIKENSEHNNTDSDEEIPSNYVILSMWHIFAEDFKCSLIWKIIVTDFSLLIWNVKACLHCWCFYGYIAGDSDTRQSLRTCLGHLGWSNRDRIISILCHAAQGGQGKYKCVAVTCHCRQCYHATFANVNSA